MLIAGAVSLRFTNEASGFIVPVVVGIDDA